MSASDNPIAADDAGVQVLHGVPGATVDVYVDGIAIATNFTAGNIAGPIALAPGDYDVALFASEADAPANAADRTDEALISATVPVGSDPATLVAHLSESGDLALGAFAEGLSDLDPGQARITVRHLMATGPLDASINGEIVGSLQPGTETTIEVEAGQVAIELIGADGTVVTSATVGVEDGELASLSAIGIPDADTAEILIQRYTGLATAPAAVPTGDSGLLGLEDDQFGLRLVYGLMAVLALSGGAVALRRQRSWS